VAKGRGEESLLLEARRPGATGAKGSVDINCERNAESTGLAAAVTLRPGLNGLPPSLPLLFNFLQRLPPAGFPPCQDDYHVLFERCSIL
jgi:hypothetical protein